MAKFRNDYNALTNLINMGLQTYEAVFRDKGGRKNTQPFTCIGDPAEFAKKYFSYQELESIRTVLPSVVDYRNKYQEDVPKNIYFSLTGPNGEDTVNVQMYNVRDVTFIKEFEDNGYFVTVQQITNAQG